VLIATKKVVRFSAFDVCYWYSIRDSNCIGGNVVSVKKEFVNSGFCIPAYQNGGSIH
jgi:hypothetical protein